MAGRMLLVQLTVQQVPPDSDSPLRADPRHALHVPIHHQLHAGTQPRPALLSCDMLASVPARLGPGGRHVGHRQGSSTPRHWDAFHSLLIQYPTDKAQERMASDRVQPEMHLVRSDDSSALS